MKKYMTKPVIALLAAVTIAGGLTPLWANASTSLSTSSKVVMNDEGEQVTRYNLKELAKNDPATLNMLLKTQADHLYIVVEDLNLDVKMSTYIEQHEADWNKIYNERDDIYLEVRFDDGDDGFVSVTPETKDNKTYIIGEVSDDVTLIVVTKPNGDTIEVVPTENDTFTVNFAAVESNTPQYATLKAYVDDTVVDTKRVQVNTEVDDEEEKDVILKPWGTYDHSKDEVKVNGIVSLEVDKVYVTVDGVKKEASVKKLWEGIGSFTVTYKGVKTDQTKALVEAYEDGDKIDSETITLLKLNGPGEVEESSYEIKGTATLSAKHKLVQLKGSIEAMEKLEENDKLKLLVTAPDGKKHEVKLSDNAEFNVNINYGNRSFSSKYVHLELYSDNKLVAQADIAHGAPLNQVIVKPKPASADDKGKGKDKHDKHQHGKGKEHAPGQLKKLVPGAALEIEFEHDDDDDEDDREND